MPEVAPFSRLQPLRQKGGVGLIGQQGGESGMGQMKQGFVVPKRIVGVKADGCQTKAGQIGQNWLLWRLERQEVRQGRASGVAKTGL